ncbi:MAG: bifunctional oligoribonuclease/PAP phosphatase NrnA [Bacteroidia bacterium]
MHQLDLAPIKKLISEPKRIAITAHQRPDGDAIGSSMGLYHSLKNLGHKPVVIMPTDYPPNLKWLPDDEKVLITPNNEEAAKQAIHDAELIFCLDLNDLKRVAPLDEAIATSSVPVIMMDHHLDPKGFHAYAYWDDKAASTAEMVYRLFRDAGLDHAVDQTAAQALYMGILTDSGSFRFPAVTAELHRIVADLMDKGARPNVAYEQIYNNDSHKRLTLLGHILNERLTFLPEYNAALMILTKEDYEKFDIQSGETEGFVNFPLSVKNVNLSIYLAEWEDMVKMSFRSRGTFPANELAGHFSGGGHRNAAGGRSLESLEAVKAKLMELLPTYKTQLDYNIMDVL